MVQSGLGFWIGGEKKRERTRESGELGLTECVRSLGFLIDPQSHCVLLRFVAHFFSLADFYTPSAHTHTDRQAGIYREASSSVDDTCRLGVADFFDVDRS